MVVWHTSVQTVQNCAIVIWMAVWRIQNVYLCAILSGGQYDVLQNVHYCLCDILNRMVVSMTYYGLSLNTGNLAGDFYLNYFLAAVMDFPAYTLCLMLMDRWGRKKCHCSAMLLGGIACLSTILTTTFGGKGIHSCLDTSNLTLSVFGNIWCATKNVL